MTATPETTQLPDTVPSTTVRPGRTPAGSVLPESAPPESALPGSALPGYLVRVPSPLGRIEITSDGDAVTSLSIEKGGRLPHDFLPEHSTPVLEAAAAQLGEYFAGVRRDFDVPVKLVGTPFQQAVWKELRALEWGAVASYGSVGIATGRPTAGRAVGGAVGANPIPIIVPCHRILASNGRITGYSAGEGVPTKSWLLDHEGIVHHRVRADAQPQLSGFTADFGADSGFGAGAGRSAGAE